VYQKHFLLQHSFVQMFACPTHPMPPAITLIL
jgi:hypothetical protein